MSRQLKLIAVVAVVLVAISGFGPARKGGGHRSSGSGGGCSSSTSSSHNSYDSSHNSSYDSTDSDSGYSSGHNSSHSSGYRSGSGTRSHHGSTGYGGTASGSVTECAARSGNQAKAVVEVRNPKGYSKTYRVRVEFLDASGLRVDSGSAEVTVGGRDTGPVDVPMANPKRIGDVSECRVTSVS